MLALIAGQGRLPTIVADRAHPAEIVALDGFPPDDLAPTRRFRIERLGTLIADLRAAGVTEVAFAGAIRRPPLDPSEVDAATMPLVPRMMQAIQRGDDAALRTVLDFFEEAGLAIRAVQDLVPDLLPKAGCVTSHKLSRDQDEEVIRAVEILSAIGRADIGQSCVVHHGQCLAVEASFGTDWMLRSLANRPDGQGGVLYKAPKPGQDRRIDLPTIGPGTVASAAAAKLDGIAVEEGGVFVLDYDKTVAAAEAAGIWLWVRKP